MARICFPKSKLATADYLKSYFDEDVDLYRIYRYLNKLEDTEKERVQINYEKIKDDAGWDGLKGYATDTALSSKQIYDEYSELWQVERAFRISNNASYRPIQIHRRPLRERFLGGNELARYVTGPENLIFISNIR